MTSAYTKIYGYERPHVSGYTAYTEISGYTERIRRTRVDARCIRIKKFADTKISGYVLTGPQSKHARMQCTVYNTRPVNISLPTSGLILGSYTVEVVIIGCFPTQLKPYYFPWLIPHFSINSFRLFPSYFSLRSSQFIPLARFRSLASFTSCRSVQKRRQKSHSIYLEWEINQGNNRV